MKLLDRYGREVEAGDKVCIFEPVVVVGAPWEVVSVEEAPLVNPQAMRVKFQMDVTMFQPANVNTVPLVRCATAAEMEVVRAQANKPKLHIPT